MDKRNHAIHWIAIYPVDSVINLSNNPGLGPVSQSKAPETFRARKAIFSSSISENGELYRPETSCVKRTSVYIKNT